MRQLSIAGTKDGTNPTFTLTPAPGVTELVLLWRNGLLQSPGLDYTLSGPVVTFVAGNVPLSNDPLLAFLDTPTAASGGSGGSGGGGIEDSGLFNTGRFGSFLFGGRAQRPVGSTLNSTLLKAALRKAGVTLAPGRGPNAEQIAEAIGEENRMIGSWNCNPLNIFTNRIDLVSTIANQQSYTIGLDPNGTSIADFDLPRPQEIIRANFLLPTASDPIHKVRRALKIWSDRDWASIEFQAVYTYPEGLYYDGGCDPVTGFGTVYFRPIPNGIYQIELYTWQAIQQFTNAEDAVVLPPGYEDAIVNNLAVRLASMPWPVQVPMNPQVRIDAIVSLNAIQQMNVTAPRLKSDPELTGGRGTLSWMTGLRES